MVIHDRNCTRCKHRLVIKPKKGKGEIELCRLTSEPIPLPFGPKMRYCDRFQQEGCTCNNCTQDGLHS